MRRSLVLCVLFVFLMVGAGCGRSSFVGKRLDNFSAYYNTFYNAEKALEEGVKAIDTGQAEQVLDQDLYLPLFGGSERGTTQRKPFEDAILKCADILRKHPDSKWVDDALLVIGQAWFYTQNYVGAEEKFKEVMTLESRLHDEARFWLARTFIASGQYEAAFDHLQESLNREDVSRRWEPKLRLALAELHVQRKDWDAAAADLESGLEGVRDNELSARSYFLLGQVYETLGRYDEAVAAYDRVRSYNPFYELTYAAQYSAARVEGTHGDPDRAMQRLRRMERDDKNYDHRADLAFLRGSVLQASGYYDEALDVYHELLYDPNANATSIRGQTHYALGVFYRDVDEDYPYAAAYFDTAQSSLARPTAVSASAGGGSPTQPAYAPAAITDSDEQARVFKGFADVMGEISRMDSLLYLGSLDDSTFQAAILEIRRQRAEELEAQRREMERLQAERNFQQGASSAGFNSSFGRTPAGKQTGNSPEDKSAGYLFHRDAVRMQEARADFQLRWGNRPLAPNWRRIDAASNVAVEGAESDSLQAEGEVSAEDGLPEVDISAVPRDSLSQLAMLAERAVARYELANVLFLSMNQPDSAASWYRMVIEQDSDEPVAQRAYYALAEVQRALGDTLAAQRLYRTIVDRYPESDFSEQAYERLGLEPQESISTDTLAQAETAYDQAYAVWQRQDYHQSLNDMVALALHYTETEVAPRALFAAGSVYMEWAARDSLDLFDVLPLTLPDSVLYTSVLFQPPPAPPSLPPADPNAAPGEASPPDAPIKQIDAPAEQDDTPVKQIDTPVKQIDTPVDEGDTPVKQIDTPAEEVGAPVKQIDVPAEVSDSLAVATDSLALADAALADSTTPPEPEPEPEPEPIRLETLYTSLRAQYPQSIQAEPAGRILTALQERKDAIQALADSLAADSLAALDSLAATVALAADSLATDSLAVDSLAVDSLAADSLAADSLVAGVEPPEDQTDTPADSAAASMQKDRLLGMLDARRERAQEGRPDSLNAPADPGEAEPEAEAVVGLGKIDWSQGGWTIILRTETEPEMAQGFATNYGYALSDMDYPIDIYSAIVREEVEYRVAVGLFANEQEAKAAFSRMEDRLPGDARIVQVPKTP